MNESGERLNRAAAKAALYSLLAQALNYPEKDLVDNLCQGGFLGEIMDALDVLGIEGLRSSLETFQKEYTDPGVNRKNLLLEIEKDYTWMCFASKPRRLVYLFESVYNEGKLFDESTFQIARLYYEAGLKVEESFRLPPDHIAVELEFMAFLSFKELEGIKAGDRKIEEYAVELQNRTLDEHLRKFALAVAANLGKHAKAGFYQLTAQVVTALFSHM
ncbi:MAG: chaperone protein TorD [Deltaproteobacteria bacterium ADurb.BinA179]|jgi:TorA maturation chaperone TorD|nr:molecular chaperone TorD family protein [Deltaproteobacteria bacterium]MDI9542053.1 molecular chaperone TorD family protein [Pseudomonadota bacterium]NLW68042.1 molecular chaperone TorD family protein [Bacteriovoracaceae bacterium]OPZ29292.1 MAG: chaperone protein TorD [Deltaproteobacteria bacterium ADurb.BinA179]HRR70636.1 molecular chaperone TorD family protein [Desulfomonilia bacterium]